MTKVKNLNHTGDNYPKPKCGCGNWLSHWENNKNVVAGWCRCCGKKIPHADLVGGHVKKVYSYDESYYIVPLCHSCNAIQGKEFDVNDSDLVPASAEKCKKASTK